MAPMAIDGIRRSSVALDWYHEQSEAIGGRRGPYMAQPSFQCLVLCNVFYIHFWVIDRLTKDVNFTETFNR